VLGAENDADAGHAHTVGHQALRLRGTLVVVPCSCTPDVISADCMYLIGCLDGVAKRRADIYAEEVAGVPTSAEIREAAATGCADLAACARVRGELADVFGAWAALQLAVRSLKRRRG
jgi:hypothetical protein